MHYEGEKFEGALPKMSSTNIFLNVNELKKGCYILKILNNNKVITKIKFKK